MYSACHTIISGLENFTKRPQNNNQQQNRWKIETNQTKKKKKTKTRWVISALIIHLRMNFVQFNFMSVLRERTVVVVAVATIRRNILVGIALYNLQNDSMEKREHHIWILQWIRLDAHTKPNGFEEWVSNPESIISYSVALVQKKNPIYIEPKARTPTKHRILYVCTLFCSTFTYPATGKLNAKLNSKCGSESKVFVVIAGCFFLFVVGSYCIASSIQLLRFGRLRYV